MQRSGGACTLNGLYRTSCACAETLEFITGSRFPICISCNRSVAWVYLQPLLSGPVAGPEAVSVEAQVCKLRDFLRRETSSDPTILFALGKSLLRLGRVGPALEAIYGVLDQAPGNLSAHLELGRALLGFRQSPEAIKVLERGAEIARRTDDLEALQEFLALIDQAQPGREPRSGRSAQRAPLDVIVTRSDAIHPGVYAAVNISETGICIRSGRCEAEGGFVALDFRLAGEETRIYAKVIWCRNDLGGPRERPFMVGLQFLSPASSIVERIRAYVRHRHADEEDASCRSRFPAE